MCTECSQEAAELREKRDSEARDYLTKRAAKRSEDGWPCAMQRLCVEDQLHTPENVTLVHVARCLSWGVVLPQIRRTDRAPVCKQCGEWITRQALLREGLND